eukprot:TRINITY_DN64828_c0_g1_i1.p1 TRINITY_DN64828_c0_g1~~TRINITY_DN64828_c0_g1_i1.p1  ORF type:complete len:132 (-),score=19.91 TRINITY_DN64828_c0_g1_i1:235-630(-)
MEHINQDLIRSLFDERLKSIQLSTHLQDTLKGLLCFLFEVFTVVWVFVNGEESGRDVAVSHGLGVGNAVTAKLAKSPSSSGLDVIFGFIDESVKQRVDGFGIDDGSCIVLVEGGNITESHDSGQSSVSFGV